MFTSCVEKTCLILCGYSARQGLPRRDLRHYIQLLEWSDQNCGVLENSVRYCSCLYGVEDEVDNPDDLSADVMNCYGVQSLSNDVRE